MMPRSLPLAIAAALAALVLAAPPASAVVGGRDADQGEYPSVAQITFGPFGCTGTLVAPDWVLSAGHCGSATGVAVASPVGWPTAAITVRVGSWKRNDGEQVPVEQVVVSPSYLGLTNRHDISLLKLTRASVKSPTPIAATAERSSWEPGKLMTIAGWGNTREGGGSPSTLQEAEVPIVTDAYARSAYSSFDAETMVGAGYPQGGVDTCQGDSGGPLFAPVGQPRVMRVVGATSWGEGCARAGKPGIYARVADTTLRTWIASVAPSAVATEPAPGQ